MIALDVQSQAVIDSSTLSGWERFRLLLRLQRYALPYWDKVLLRIVSSLIGSCLALLPPLFMARLIDVAFPTHDYGMIAETALLATAAMLVGQVMSWLAGAERSDQQPLPANVMGAYTMSRIALDLKLQFYRHMQTLSMDFFARRPVGEHMFRCTTDIDDAAYIASEVIPKVVSTTQRIVVLSLVLSLTFKPWILIPAALFLVVLFVTKHTLTGLVRRWDRAYRVQYQRLEAVLREILYPSKVIKAYALARTARRWYGSQAVRMVTADFRRTLFIWSDFLISATMLPIYLAILTFIIGGMVLGKQLSVGEYTAASLLMTQLVAPFQEAITTFQMIRQKLVPTERMIETLDVNPEITDAPDARVLTNPQGKVEVRDVSFAYGDGANVLDAVSLVAKPGEKVAIVGPNGAGKSTLCALLLRLYDPATGELRFDDIPYRAIAQESLRNAMAIVTDSPTVFSESIESNIRYGRPTAPPDRVLRAAAIARVDEFLSRTHAGYATVLSESGAISGGQKQRLCIARALVRDASVLILDEATSALDPITEKEVVDLIDQEYADRTRVVVAHNVFSARTADRIYVLDRGRVVAVGSHSELMEGSPFYRALWAGHDARG